MNISVATKYGTVEGKELNGVFSWKGIPYASPPTGKRRFKRPLPPAPWNGILKACEFGPSPVQVPKPLGGISKGTSVSEDCLYLNIWSPGDSGRKYPVMFWIYGGAFVSGSSSIDMYDGRNLCLNENIVIVTFNYRVGVLGFTDFSFLGEEFECNNGIADQIAALKWVYENIENFGGDPENITIIGQSAGGHSVTTLLSIPEARKYISKAVAMSSYPASIETKSSAQTVAEDFLNSAGISLNDPDLLFKISAKKLMKASVKFADKVSARCRNEFAFLPVIDGDILKDHPLHLAGMPLDGKNIPLVLGMCQNEGALYSKTKIPLFTVKEKDVFKFLEYSEGKIPENMISLYDKYPRDLKYTYVGGDIVFRLPVTWYADRYCKSADVFMYSFNIIVELLKLMKLYTIHGTDIPFLFNNLDAKVSKLALMLDPDKDSLDTFSKRFGRQIAEFFRTGTAPWEPYDPDSRPVKIYDRMDSFCHNPLKDEDEAWKQTHFYGRLFEKGTENTND